YLQALGLDPRATSQCFTRLARALANVDRFAEVQTLFDEAKEKLHTSADSARTGALYDWGCTFLSLGLADEAEKTIREVLKTSMEDAYCYHLLGLALKNQGRAGEAIERYRRSHEILEAKGHQGRKVVLANWAFALLDLERFDEAVERAKQALD